MLSQEDKYRLAVIALALREDDPRFVAAIGSGKPRRPREYRWSRSCVLLLLAASFIIAAVVASSVLLLLAALPTGVAGVAVLPPRWPDRPRSRWWHRRRRW
jgi:Flp pilus assembly protein TadB